MGMSTHTHPSDRQNRLKIVIEVNLGIVIVFLLNSQFMCVSVYVCACVCVCVCACMRSCICVYIYIYIYIYISWVDSKTLRKALVENLAKKFHLLVVFILVFYIYIIYMCVYHYIHIYIIIYIYNIYVFPTMGAEKIYDVYCCRLLFSPEVRLLKRLALSREGTGSSHEVCSIHRDQSTRSVGRRRGKHQILQPGINNYCDQVIHIAFHLFSPFCFQSLKWLCKSLR